MREINDLARQAASRFGLLTTHDLGALGCSERETRTFVSSGVLTRVRRGVYVLAGTVCTWEHELMRACLAGSSLGVVSHRAALRLWDLRPREQVVEVTFRGHAAPRVDGAVVHRSYDLEPEDITDVGGLPVTSPVRTLVDAGVHFPIREVQRLVDTALGLDLVSTAELWLLRERVGRHGRTGVGALAEVLEGMPDQVDGTESPREVALRRLIRDHGLRTPTVQFPVVAGGEPFRIDLAYPEARVLLEYDGFLPHVDPAQFVRDRRRQNLLVLDGWLVLRFTHGDLRDRPGWVAGQINRAVAGRSRI